MLKEPEGLASKIRSFSKNNDSLLQKNSLLSTKPNINSNPIPKIPSSVTKGIIKNKDFSGKRITEEINNKTIKQ